MNSPAFTESTLITIIESMTAHDEADNSQAGGWHCEDAIYKVARVNLKHNGTAPALRQMLFALTARGKLEHTKAYGLNKFRLTPEAKPDLTTLLADVDSRLTQQPQDCTFQKDVKTVLKRLAGFKRAEAVFTAYHPANTVATVSDVEIALNALAEAGKVEIKEYADWTYYRANAGVSTC